MSASEAAARAAYTYLHENNALCTIGGSSYPWHLAGDGIKSELTEAVRVALQDVDKGDADVD